MNSKSPMIVKTVEDLENLKIEDSGPFIYSKLDKSSIYVIRKEHSKSYQIADGEVYTGQLYFCNNMWKVEATFFNKDYEEFFESLSLAFNFIIEKVKTTNKAIPINIDLTEAREIKMPKYRIDYLDKLFETRRPFAVAVADTIYKYEETLGDKVIEELLADTVMALEEIVAKYQSDLWEYRQRFGDLN